MPAYYTFNYEDTLDRSVEGLLVLSYMYWAVLSQSTISKVRSDKHNDVLYHS